MKKLFAAVGHVGFAGASLLVKVAQAGEARHKDPVHCSSGDRLAAKPEPVNVLQCDKPGGGYFD